MTVFTQSPLKTEHRIICYQCSKPKWPTKVSNNFSSRFNRIRTELPCLGLMLSGWSSRKALDFAAICCIKVSLLMQSDSFWCPTSFLNTFMHNSHPAPLWRAVLGWPHTAHCKLFWFLQFWGVSLEEEEMHERFCELLESRACSFKVLLVEGVRGVVGTVFFSTCQKKRGSRWKRAWNSYTFYQCLGKETKHYIYICIYLFF